MCEGEGARESVSDREVGERERAGEKISARRRRGSIFLCPEHSTRVALQHILLQPPPSANTADTDTTSGGQQRQQKNNIVDDGSVSSSSMKSRAPRDKRQRPKRGENVLKSDLFLFIFFSGNRKRA